MGHYAFSHLIFCVYLEEEEIAMDSFFLIGIILSLIFSFFFATVERTYHAANKLQLEVEGRLGKTSGKIMSFFVKHPSWFMGTIIIGATVSLVVFSCLAALIFMPIAESLFPIGIHKGIIIIFQTFLSTLIILFVVVILPRSLSRVNPNSLLSALAIPFTVSFVLLFFLMYPLIGLTKFVTVRVLRLKYDEENPFVGQIDLSKFIRGLSKPKPETEDIELDKKIFHNALEFKTVKIRDCMIPRTEITAVEINESIENLREAFVESGHSKVIVYKQSIDEITGYCHSSSLFKKPKQIKDILTPIIIVAETTLANELMIRFINERKSLAVVVDEFGGTSGIVSMEDVIEEIFGEIEDEHDEEDQRVEQKIDDNTYLLSARLEIDYLNETYHWELPTGEYETLGGLILSYTEDFPKKGQTILLPPFTFVIQATGDNRIDTILVKLNVEGIPVA